MISALEQLIQYLAKLPGLGPRSARRVALHLLKRRETLMLPLTAALSQVAADVRPCNRCGNLDVTDPCAICQSAARGARDTGLLCVVADVGDLWALERSHAYKGLYHVLGGTLSALEGVRPQDLRIDALIARLESGGAREVILALGATVEGQTTSHYVAEKIAPFGITVSRLAQGMPVGGELDYLDDGTLAAALAARRTAS